MFDLSVEPLSELELLPVELPAPELVLELVPLFMPEDEDVELGLSDELAPELVPEPAVLELPEPEIAPDEVEPSVDLEVDDDERSREPDTLPDPETDESTEPVAAPPRIVVSLRAERPSRSS